MAKSLGIIDKLLIAAKDITDAGRATFSAEDLVVAAWERYPDAFGLAGHLDESGTPKYPNSNRVYAEIMGSKPLRKQGLLRKVGNKLYRLTEAGRARAATAAHAGDYGSPKKLALARESVEQIRRLFESKAATKARAANIEDVSFFEACGFWGIGPQANSKDLSSRFAHIEAIIDTVMRALGGEKAASARHGAVPFTADDLRTLLYTHTALQERFASEITVIRSRKDERK